jgi:hypothetical protein
VVQDDALERAEEMVVFTSDDGGRTFHGPGLAPTGYFAGEYRKFTTVHPGESAVLANGDFAMVWTEAYAGNDKLSREEMADSKRDAARLPGNSQIVFARSGDGGRTFMSSTVIAEGTWKLMINGTMTTFAKYYPSMAVDRTQGAFRNVIYTAWIDAASGRQKVLFSSSSDAGLTWTSPRPIGRGAFKSEAPEMGPQESMVNLAVNNAGVIGAFYYAQGDADDPLVMWPVFQISRDGGSTWSAAQRVTQHPVSIRESARNWRTLLSGKADLPPGWSEYSFILNAPICNWALTADATGAFRIFPFSTPVAAESTKDGLFRHSAVTARVSGSP